MTKCRRDNCFKPASRLKAARQERLCDDHFQIFSTGEARREWRLNTKCGYEPCQNTLSGTRNEKYCSARCRQRASRKLISEHAVSVLATSYWTHIENNIKRNPLMLGSINEPKDIVVYYHLYVRKAYHQRSYALPSFDVYQGNLKPVPLLEIELCHMQPNGKGGENTAINIFIGPKCINRKNNDSIPFQDNGFAGVSSTNERIPFDGSLYDTLIVHYGPQVVADALGNIAPAKRFYGNILRHVSFSGIEKELPLFTLLHEELWRLEHRDIAECLSKIKNMFSYYPLYLELLAITGFYAVLSGDPDRIMLRICRLFFWFFDVRSHRRFTSRAHDQYLKVMYRFIRKYLRRYFDVEIENRPDVVAFYNSLYSQTIVGIGQATDEVICYSYSMGRTRTVSTFFYAPRVVTDSEELLRLMGADLDFN